MNCRNEKFPEVIQINPNQIDQEVRSSTATPKEIIEREAKGRIFRCIGCKSSCNYSVKFLYRNGSKKATVVITPENINT